MNIYQKVNSYKYLDIATRRMVKTWKKMEEPGEIPWTPQDKSLSESTLAIISSAGLALNSDRPFDQEGERANPWWGDPSYRVLPRTAAVNEIRLYHMHINPSLVKQDLNTLFPLQTAQVNTHKVAEH